MSFNDISQKLKKDLIINTNLLNQQIIFHSCWGLFSPKKIDEGSQLLLNYLELKDNDITFDLGCGYGAIGIAVALSCKKGEVYMVDKDFVAIEYTKKNIAINNVENCTVFLSDAFSNVDNNIRFDNILSNLPAKIGREQLSIILYDAYEALKPDGKIVVVTINGLRNFIKTNFMTVFGNYKKLKQGAKYTVALAYKNK